MTYTAAAILSDLQENQLLMAPSYYIKFALGFRLTLSTKLTHLSYIKTQLHYRDLLY